MIKNPPVNAGDRRDVSSIPELGRFDLFAVQGTLKSLLQHHNSKASVLWHSAFFMVQLSHLHMTIGKTITLIIRTFVSKVLSLLFNTLSRFVITFKEQASFNFMATVTICSDFGAQGLCPN